MRLRLVLLLLRSELRALEQRIKPRFDSALSMAIDRVRACLEILS